MATYKYEAKNASGQVSSGFITAQSLAAASQMIRSRGEYILALAPADEVKSASEGIQFSFGPGLKDVQSFTSQLAVMTNPDEHCPICELDLETTAPFSASAKRPCSWHCIA